MAFQRCGGNPNAPNTYRATRHTTPPHWVLLSPNRAPPPSVRDIKHKNMMHPQQLQSRQVSQDSINFPHPRIVRSPNCCVLAGYAKAPCRPMRLPLATCISQASWVRVGLRVPIKCGVTRLARPRCIYHNILTSLHCLSLVRGGKREHVRFSTGLWLSSHQRREHHRHQQDCQLDGGKNNKHRDDDDSCIKFADMFLATEKSKPPWLTSWMPAPFTSPSRCDVGAQCSTFHVEHAAQHLSVNCGHQHISCDNRFHQEQQQGIISSMPRKMTSRQKTAQPVIRTVAKETNKRLPMYRDDANTNATKTQKNKRPAECTLPSIKRTWRSAQQLQRNFPGNACHNNEQIQTHNAERNVLINTPQNTPWSPRHATPREDHFKQLAETRCSLRTHAGQPKHRIFQTDLRPNRHTQRTHDHLLCDATEWVFLLLPLAPSIAANLALREPTACVPIVQHLTSRITWWRDGVPLHPAFALPKPSGKYRSTRRTPKHILHATAPSAVRIPKSRSQLPHTPCSIQVSKKHCTIGTCSFDTQLKQMKCPGL